MKKLLLLSIVIFVSGCTHLYKMHSYKDVEVELEAGLLAVSYSSGRWVKISKDPEITELSEPFTFRVVLLTDGLEGEKVRINVHEISGVAKGWSTYDLNVDEFTEPTYYKGRKEKSVGVAGLIKGVTSGYSEFSITFEVIYGDKSEMKTIKMLPVHWEERRNNWFDGIMSV
ncbi:hypothetical protein [Halopseudomonas oceani]|uniref:hypothetical protein n=1 Tax=Halopseudomonas oceani TaxID=1708783 RepID=UPI002AA955A3|nr:hypothetical protein [Halopseudomonas oceani]